MWTFCDRMVVVLHLWTSFDRLAGNHLLEKDPRDHILEAQSLP
jgi:hypothetical protein